VNSHNTIFYLATIAVVLTIDTNCFSPTLGVARFVDQTNRIRMLVLGRNDCLALIS
jgi:hypothetical protein